jgi:hypothetical protein
VICKIAFFIFGILWTVLELRKKDSYGPHLNGDPCFKVFLINSKINSYQSMDKNSEILKKVCLEHPLIKTGKNMESF